MAQLRPHHDGHRRGRPGDRIRGRGSLHHGMRGPARGQESHAFRGAGTTAASNASLLRRLPRGRSSWHPQPTRPKSPSWHGVVTIVRAPAGMQRLCRTVHSHIEGAIVVGQGVPERRGTAGALGEFRERYNRCWIVQRITPQQARQRILAIGAAA